MAAKNQDIIQKIQTILADASVAIELGETVESTAANLTRFRLMKPDQNQNLIFKDFRPHFFGGGRAEYNWYKNLTHFLQPMITPAFYGGVINEQKRLCALILEDITNSYVKTPDNWPTKPEELEQLEQAVDILVQLHSYWWNHKTLKISYTRQQGGPLRLAHAATPIIIRQYAQSLHFSLPTIIDGLRANFSADEIAVCERAIERWPAILIKRISGDENLTLLHGDFHIWNIFFARDEGKQRPYVLDWETYKRGLGPYDLAYLLVTACEPTIRHDQESKLLKRYYDGLQTAGIRQYDWQRCEEDYRLSLMANLFPPLMWKSEDGLKRSLAAFADWNCEELL